MVTRRDFLRLAGMGAAAMALPLPDLLAEEQRKPNVIVILADDQGYAELGCQGCKDVPTPNIDSIAKNGVRCTSGYVSCPVCSPTRAGLVTGRYQQRFGHEHNPGKELDRKNWGLPLDQKTIADYMKSEGYATGIVGKWHLGDNKQFHPNKRGFDEYFGFIGGAHPYLNPTLDSFNTIQRDGKPYDEKEYLTYAFGREAVSFIDRHKEKPFFLYLAFNAVHAPLEGAIRDAKAFPEIEDPKRRTFAKMLMAMDNAVGSVLDKVREAGLENDTLIFFLSDNGGPTPSTTSRNDPFKGYKTQVHEGGIRIPFMVQWKGHLPAGKVYDKPVISLDILPTAVAVAGGKAAANVDGSDLMPYLGGEKQGSPHHALYWRYDKQSAIRMGDWKLARHEVYGSRLFNLADDPGEANDLFSKLPDKAKELQAAWDKWNSKNVPALWQSGPHPPWTETFWQEEGS
jgi:arylsulfatase A-like enzyme